MVKKVLLDWKMAKCMVFAGLIIAGPSGLKLNAQELAEERAIVLNIVGTTTKSELDLYPTSDNKGLVYRHRIFEPTAKALRLHFQVQRSDDQWEVRILNLQGDDPAWVINESGTIGNDFWSDEIVGNQIIVEVYSAKTSTQLQLAIDRIAVINPEVEPVSILHGNQLKSIVNQADWIVALGDAVARLRYVGDDGGIYRCSAFLITEDLMLTNQHCIATESEMKSALVDFDYQIAGVIGETVKLRELLDSDYGLDYTIIRLANSSGREPLKLDVTRPEDNQKMMIIQHPAGEPKQVSIKGCKVDDPILVGRGGAETDLGHLCDTRVGSSGSPVFLFPKGKVVALHHLGRSKADGVLVNRAVHIGEILDNLTTELKAEIQLP